MVQKTKHITQVSFKGHRSGATANFLCYSNSTITQTVSVTVRCHRWESKVWGSQIAGGRQREGTGAIQYGLLHLETDESHFDKNNSLACRVASATETRVFTLYLAL